MHAAEYISRVWEKIKGMDPDHPYGLIIDRELVPYFVPYLRNSNAIDQLLSLERSDYPFLCLLGPYLSHTCVECVAYGIVDTYEAIVLTIEQCGEVLNNHGFNVVPWFMVSGSDTLRDHLQRMRTHAHTCDDGATLH